MRRCRHCGIEAGTDMSAEPICSHGGLVGSHSYEELPGTLQPARAEWTVKGPYGVPFRMRLLR